MVALKAAAIWLLILVCAVANGALREAVMLPRLGGPAALIASGILLCLCVLVVAVLLVPRLGRLSTLQCLQVGFFWLGLTLAFEFGFGRLVQDRTWPELFEAYTFKDGNLWPLVLVVTLLAPLAAPRVRTSGPASPSGRQAPPSPRGR